MKKEVFAGDTNQKSSEGKSPLLIWEREEYQLSLTILELLNSNTGNQKELIRDILYLIRDYTGIEAVGIRLQEDEDFPYYVTKGFPEDFVEAEKYLCARDHRNELIRDSEGNPYLECMCGNVICGRYDSSLPFFTSGGSFWTNSTSALLAHTREEDRQSRTRNRCNSEGYESVALIPLKMGDMTIGLLQLNDSRKDCYSLELVEYFEHLGASVGVALARKKAEEELNGLLNKLEDRVKERTEELKQVNEQLEAEISEKEKTHKALISGQAKLERILRKEISLKKQAILLAHIASDLNKTGSLNEVFHEILIKVRNAMRLYKTGIHIFENKTGLPFSPDFCIVDSNGQKCNMEDSVAFKNLFRLMSKLKEGAEIIIPDIQNLETKERDFFNQQEIKSLIMLPVKAGTDVASMICFGKKETYIWSEEEIEFYRTVSYILSNAWQRELHFQAKLDAERKQMETLHTAEKALRLASVGTLAAGIAHEINQPLNALKVTVDGMIYWRKRNYAIPEEEKAHNLQFISEQVNRIDGIIKQMRRLTRQEEKPDFSPVEINRVIRNSFSLIKQQLKLHNIEVSLELDDALSRIHGQETQMERAITNLIVNAMNVLDETCQKNKNIYIKTFSDKKSCIIVISDNGPGIPEEHIHRIFDPFFTTKFGGKGMGLGLSITHTIITEHGGTITAGNRKEGGAQIIISIPLYVSDKGES